MEPRKKCSSKDHENIDAIIYCAECKIYICNKCKTIHSKLFQNHQTFNLDKNIEDIFTGFCKEKEHGFKLDFFCKNHNQLICTACLCKIQKGENGKHKDCNVCTLEEIKDEKSNQLKNNLECLGKLYNTIEESMKKFKDLCEKINNNKDELKMQIQKEFTILRNAINKREDELLLEIDNKFKDRFINEQLIKDSEKLPNKIKLSLEKGKQINIDKNNLNLLIHDCINIEKNFKDINDIKDSIDKCEECNNLKFEINESNKILDLIKNIGEIEEDKIIMEKSSILNDDIKKQNIIFKWIKEKINKKSIKFELIFKMSENGSESKEFHKYCDNKGPTLTLIKTKKNNIFGGFTTLNWTSNSESIFDKTNSTFIFSLNLLKKYNMIDINRAAIMCGVEGPIFGDWDIGLNKNMKRGEIFANSSCNFLSDNNLELIGGNGDSESFDTKELEIYKVIF